MTSPRIVLAVYPVSSFLFFFFGDGGSPLWDDVEVEEMKTSTTLPADVLAGRVKSLGTGYSGFQVQSTSTKD